MKQIYLLIKPASSLCNMRCLYCFYTDVSTKRELPNNGIMLRQTANKIIENTFKDLAEGDEITFGFQGGEPTLAGLSWFMDFIAKVKAQRQKTTVNYSLQTNGLLLDEEWCKFLHENNFLVGLSVDGVERFHDNYRLDTQGRSTYREVMKRKELLEKHSVEYNILCVLTNDLAGDPDRIWRFILREKIRFIQFIPCLDTLEEQQPSRYTLRPARFAAFYSRLFRLWEQELETGHYVSVKFFDDIAHFFFRNIPNACGITGKCQPQYVIEADGKVYPCDFYALDEYSTGNLAEQTLREIFYSEKMQCFLKDSPPLPGTCEKCFYYKACMGGCKRMRNVMYCSQDGTICGYKTFLDKCLKPLERSLHRLSSGNSLL